MSITPMSPEIIKQGWVQTWVTLDGKIPQSRVNSRRKSTLLLLDEPSLGLSPIMADEIMERLIVIGREGMTICLVEQNVYSALSISEYAYVLESGRIAMEGKAADLITRDSVRQSYLGM